MLQEILLNEFGLAAGDLTLLLGGRVNRLWRLGSWVIKVYDQSQIPLDRVERVIMLQSELAGAGLPVPAPMRTLTGRLWAESPQLALACQQHVAGSDALQRSFLTEERVVGDTGVPARGCPVAGRASDGNG